MDNPRDIPDIRDAEELLRSAERSFPSEESAKDFSEAFELLNDHIAHQAPGDEVVELISNLKLSYTQAVLTRLYAIDTKDFFLFLSYLLLMTHTMKNEVDVLRQQYPKLGLAYDACLKRFEPQLEELLGELKTT